MARFTSATGPTAGPEGENTFLLPKEASTGCLFAGRKRVALWEGWSLLTGRMVQREIAGCSDKAPVSPLHHVKFIFNLVSATPGISVV